MAALNNFKLVGIDSNVFIYYFEGNPKFGQASKQVFNALSANGLFGVTNIITLIEVLSKKELPENISLDLEESFFDIPSLTITEVDRKIATDAARIRRKYQFRLPDSIQLATAIQKKAQVFITNDMRLKKFKELKVILLKEL